MPRLKVVGVVEEDQLVKDLRWSPKRPQRVSLECFLNDRFYVASVVQDVKKFV